MRQLVVRRFRSMNQLRCEIGESVFKRLRLQTKSSERLQF